MVTAGRAREIVRGLLRAIGRDCRRLRGAVQSPFPVRPGLFTYYVHPGGGTRRIHLRVNSDGSGVLLVDVTDAVHLNPTAAVLARSALEGVSPHQAAAAVGRRFRGVDKGKFQHQTERIYALVEHLSTTTDGCPTCGLRELPRTALFSTPVHAPYKADLALTYGCNNRCRHCYNQPGRKATASLNTGDWRRVLERLSAVGVPHVIFTGGEPTLRRDLPELIRAAERLGLVTGLNTNGRRLAGRQLADRLAAAGLNHVQITLESHRADVHNTMTGADSFRQTVGGIENSLAAGLHTITNTTLTRRNIRPAEQIVEFLHSLGLRTFAMNGMIHAGCGRNHQDAIAEEDLAPALLGVRDRAAELGMRFLWYTPTAYCRLSPLQLELGPRRCNAGEYSICIEPDGDVLPCQSYYQPAGNMLRDPWEQIWQSELFLGFRNRVADPAGSGLPQMCWDCPDLPLCAGGCPLQIEDCRLQIADCKLV